MSDSHATRGPRFKAGDPIKMVGPGPHNGKSGTIMELVNPTTGDFVYRYRVRFIDSTAETFFGFELEPAD